MSKQSRREFCKRAAGAVIAGGASLSLLSCAGRQSPPTAPQTLVADTPPPKAKLKLEGGFIEFWGGMLTDQSFNSLGPCAWKQVLRAMRDLQMDTVIIKRTQTDADDFLQPPDLPKIVLNYAKEKPKMSVFIGTRNTAIWDPIAFGSKPSDQNPDKLWRDEEKEKNLTLIQRIWDAYNKEESFAGWYISQEIGNEPGWYELLPELKDYYGALCGKCKTLAADKPIALSPYFNPYSTATDKFLTADRFAEEYGRFLDELKSDGKYLVDIIMLQDSVGERGIKPADLARDLLPYYKAMGEVCTKRGLKLWGNVESFNLLGSGQRVPADPSRLAAQINVAPEPVQKLVTFDFFHYMNPYNHLYYDPAFKKAQKDLYDGYNKEFVKNTKLENIKCPS